MTNRCRKGLRNMRTSILLCYFLLCSGTAFASGDGSVVMHAKVDLSDRASLQRGARIFVNYCLSCHSASYMRFNRMVEDLGITEEVLKENLMFGTDKPGDTMTVAMRKEDARSYFGMIPPDLSVISRARGADWLYTFLMTFYLDPTRPFGVNNLQFKGVAMPHVLWELQGLQKAVTEKETLPNGNAVERITHLELETEGQQTPEIYAQTVQDLVNFLVYLGEPVQLQRYTIGSWVILYLLVFLGIAYLLKKEYWKDVH